MLLGGHSHRLRGKVWHRVHTDAIEQRPRIGLHISNRVPGRPSRWSPDQPKRHPDSVGHAEARLVGLMLNDYALGTVDCEPEDTRR
jgi:hypothetical protein